MFYIYGIQLVIFLIISMLTFVIIYNLDKKKKNSKNQEQKNEIEASIQLEKSNSKTVNLKYIISVLIFIFGLVLIVVEYSLEKPQVKSEIEINVNSNIFDSQYKVYYHNKDITNQVNELVNLDTSKICEYTIVANIPYRNKVLKKEILIKVKDKEAPVITLEFENMQKVSYKKDLTKEGFIATDNIDQNVNDKVNVECIKKEGDISTYRYSVSDDSLNTTICEISLEIIDDVKPEITLNGEENIQVNLNESYDEKGATAIDEIDGDLSDRLQIISNVDTSSPGTYIVQYSVTDNSNNRCEVTRNVTVLDPNTGIGTIFLTFDDGPSYLTPQILDILKQRNVKATFFIIDYNPEDEYIIKRIVDEGHTIAIHGTSHIYSQIYSSEEAFMYNITSLREKIKNTTGIDTKILRFPGGSSNTVSRNYCTGIMTNLTKRLTSEGYKYFDWNVDSNDAGGASSSNEIYNNVTSTLVKDRSNVILMHDASSKIYTLNALNDIITFGYNNGYKFSNITNATHDVHHSVNN